MLQIDPREASFRYKTRILEWTRKRFGYKTNRHCIRQGKDPLDINVSTWYRILFCPPGRLNFTFTQKINHSFVQLLNFAFTQIVLFAKQNVFLHKKKIRTIAKCSVLSTRSY